MADARYGKMCECGDAFCTGCTEEEIEEASCRDCMAGPVFKNRNDCICGETDLRVLQGIGATKHPVYRAYYGNDNH